MEPHEEDVLRVVEDVASGLIAKGRARMGVFQDEVDGLAWFDLDPVDPLACPVRIQPWQPEEVNLLVGPGATAATVGIFDENRTALLTRVE